MTSPRPLPTTLCALACLAVFGLLGAWAAARVPLTIDEPLYLTTGRVLTRGADWDNRYLRFQGPLPLYFNQTLLAGLGDEELARADPESLRFRARLGMLPFGLATAWLTWAWARRIYGRAGGLIALCAYALHPLAPAHAALLNVDQAHALFTLAAALSVWCTAHAQDERRRRGWVLAGGLAVGALLATKYLAVISAPIALGALAWAAAGPSTPGGWAGRARRRALAALVAAPGVLLALHASYLFRGGFAWSLLGSAGGSWESALVDSVMGLPIVGPLLGALPRAWLQGLDMMIALEHAPRSNYLAGALAPTHALYFPLAVAAKSPEPWLVLAGIGLVRIAWGAVAAPDGGERTALRVILPLAAAPLAYLCLRANIQPGVRYVYQLLPLACVPMGWVATWPVWRRHPALARLVPAAALACAALELARSGPNFLAYFNRSSGGQLGSIRWFRDSNNDFGQMRGLGPARLRERYGDDCYVLAPLEGPRLGRLAVYVTDFSPPDPRSPGRARHWLDPFAPVDHVEAAWFVFELAAEDWERAAAESGDARVRADAALALAAAGLAERARSVLAGGPGAPTSASDPTVDPELGPELRAVLELAAAAPPAADDGAARRALARAWLRAARPDLCLEWLGDARDPDAAALRAEALLARGEPLAAARELDRPDVFAADPFQRLVAAESYLRAGRALRCLELLETADAVPADLAASAAAIAERARSRVDQARALGLALAEDREPERRP